MQVGAVRAPGGPKKGLIADSVFKQQNLGKTRKAKETLGKTKKNYVFKVDG